MIKPSLSIILLTRHYDPDLRKKINIFPDWISEILVVEDAPLSPVKEKGRVKVFSRPLAHDYAAQRNWSLEQVTGKWTMFLDDDEIPNKRFFPQLWELLNRNDLTALALQRNQVFLGQTLHYGDGGQQVITRIAQTKLGFGKWQGKIHEVWHVPQPLLVRDLCLDHHNETSLSDFLARLHDYAQHDALERGSLSFGQLLIEILVFPPLKFGLDFLVKQGFRDGWAGFVHAWCMSYYSALIRVYQYENSRR